MADCALQCFGGFIVCVILKCVCIQVFLRLVVAEYRLKLIPFQCVRFENKRNQKMTSYKYLFQIQYVDIILSK